MGKIKSVVIFPNGNIAVFDESGQQVPSLQEPWLNFKGLNKLAKRIAKDRPNVEGSAYIPTSAFTDYLTFHFAHNKPKSTEKTK